MPNIGILLRAEIQRLARRVARQMNADLKRDVVALKHRVSELTKLSHRLRQESAKLLADYAGRVAAPPVASGKEVEKAHLGPQLILAQRRRLGLSRKAFGKLIGVSAGSVFAWEGGRARPREKARAVLIAIRKLGKREARWRLDAIKAA